MFDLLLWEPLAGTSTEPLSTAAEWYQNQVYTCNQWSRGGEGIKGRGKVGGEKERRGKEGGEKGRDAERKRED